MFSRFAVKVINIIQSKELLKMKAVTEYMMQDQEIKTIIDGLSRGKKEQLIAGITGPGRGLVISAIYEAKRQKQIIVTHQLNHAQQLYEDITEFSENENVYIYPVNELLAAEMAVSSPEMQSARINALSNWLRSDDGILIAPIAAFKRMMPPQSYWADFQISYQTGHEIPLNEMLLQLVQMGYQRADMVTAPAEFSLRGGILDIYPSTEKYPVRIELFDEEVDSIRYFDADTQRSMEKMAEITIGPAQEVLLKEADFQIIAERIEGALGKQLKKMKSSEEKETLYELTMADIEKFKAKETFTDMYKYSQYFYQKHHNLLDYLPQNGLLIFDEMNRIQEIAHTMDREEVDFYKTLLSQGKLLGQTTFSFTYDAIEQKARHQKVYLSLFMKKIKGAQPDQLVNLSSRVMQEFHGQMNLFKQELERWQSLDYSVIIACVNEKRAEKVQSILRDYDMEAVVQSNYSLPLKQPIIAVSQLPKGIEMSLSKLAILTESELFKKKPMRKRRNQTITNAERIKNYQELKIGDYVVHRNHGIGKYVGIETLKVNGLHKDFLVIHYSGDDKLFVPIDQLDLVQKFVGSEGKEPRLYKLGGAEWTKVKHRVQSSVEDIADDLIKLYAEREAQKGYAFDKDTEMQKEFELAFPYQETEDQLRCIEEIKIDMEKERPMDRLLCGDVGYGKTEVAIRAIFKAIAEGKQAAVLVPTTILAQQHFQTMLERFQDYPINIGLLSRFRTRKQQNETINDLRKGLIDIVIGTHRLLSKDVEYKDLGLLVVDEEQRFGVKHKEKIKEIKSNVDVLTLTATPIPRTLHMSMLGIRDLSVIETPPENRFPVQTYVMEQERAFVREAIERELARGGQVFLLYNRIDNIEKIAADVSRLVPDARVSIAHGRMSENELENEMVGFLEGESDVLVSTTIIETGVDIPNVNTLIVYNADHMGLSQLYQLRGRVGRSNRVAYAYFMYQKDKILTEVSEKRLQAIKEFTELGSGFKIAMRDLSIRGAGNLLGKQQHGFIDSVGFDLYSQMLKEAIESKRLGKPIETVQPFNPELLLSIDAYIPETYITDEKQKIDMYKRFQALETEEDVMDLQEELIDRFGDYGMEVEHLFQVSQLRIVAKHEYVELIKEDKQQITCMLTTTQSMKIDGAKLFELANTFKYGVQLGTKGDQLILKFKLNKIPKDFKYQYVKECLAQLEGVKRTSEEVSK